ncbi:MAG: hypothetical protein L0Y57_02435 [Beijerinckiaceae bacterium]|nr:hypothetical protein [Beijerinckiaceae bacterium]
MASRLRPRLRDSAPLRAAASRGALLAIKLSEAIEALYPALALVHVFPGSARAPHAVLLQHWLSRPGCRD